MTQDSSVPSGKYILSGDLRGAIINIESTLVDAQQVSDIENLRPEPGTSPYRGLLYFDEADAGIFRGREELTAKLVSRLREWRFMAVIGASGSGKSSVIRAGLIPTLRHGEQMTNGALPPSGSEHWLIRIFTPTAYPLDALAAALLPEAKSPHSTSLRDDLLSRPIALSDFVNTSLSTDRPHLLLVVDQFEELFSAAVREPERQALIDNLVHAAAGDATITILIVLRADFYGQLSKYARLFELVAGHQEPIGGMSREELFRAIVQPAEAGDWKLQEGLAELMLDETGKEPSRLPLLSHALQETWKRRRGLTMTLSGYRESGGVHRAIAQTAERIYGDLDKGKREIARRIFVELVELGEGVDDTRRRLRPGELADHGWYRPHGTDVLERLIKARLVTVDDQTIQIVHEALIREWPRLREWLDADRAGERLRRGVQRAAREWDEHGRDPSYLFEGARLAAAREWAVVNPGRLDKRGAAFLTAGVDKAEREEQEAEAERQREVAQAKALAEEQAGRAMAEKRRSRAIRRAAIGLVVLGLVVVLAVVFAINRQGASARQADVARSRALSIASQDAVSNDTHLALLLAVEAARASETTEAFGAVRRALTAGGVELFSLPQVAGVNQATWNADESRILTASDDGRVQVWEAMPDGELLSVRHDSEIFQATWNADESRILTASADDTARVWDATTGEELLTLQHANWVVQAKWNADESRILTAGGDPLPEGKDLEYAARVWDAATGEELLALRHEHTVTQATWSADERRILTASGDGTARVWDATTGGELLTLPHPNWVNWATWNADGSRILTVNGQPGAYKEPGSAARVWDATTGEELLTLPHEDEVYHAVWNADESRILTTSGDFSTGEARVWDATTGKELLKLSPGFTRAGIYPAVGLEAMWNSDESRILIINGEGAGEVFNATTGEQLPMLADEWSVAAGETLQGLRHEDAISQATWSNDRGRILTASQDGTARVWDVTPGEELLALRHNDRIHQATWSADQRRILTASDDDVARVWDATTGEELLELRQPFGAYMAAWNVDESRILTAGGDTARVWDSATGELLLELPHEKAFAGPMWNGDGSRILTAGYDGQARVWDAETGDELLALPHEGVVDWVGWNPDGSRILMASHVISNTLISDPSVMQVWDATTGREILTFEYINWVNRVTWNSDGSQFLTGSAVGNVQVWDAARGNERLELPLQLGALNRVSWSSDESRILTSTNFGSTRIWDAATGEEVFALRGDGTPVLDVSWNADGSRILIATEGGQVSIHYTRMDDLIAAACSRLGRNMTWNEWQQYFPNRPYRLTCPDLPAHNTVPEGSLIQELLQLFDLFVPR